MMSTVSARLQTTGSPFVLLSVRPTGGRAPAVCYGVEDGPVTFVWRVDDRLGCAFRVEVCVSLGLRIQDFPSDVGYSEMVDQLVGVYLWNSGVRAHGLVVVIDGADHFEYIHLLAGWLDKVGFHYAQPFEGDPPFERPALPYHAILECADPVGLQRVSQQLRKHGVAHATL